MGLYLDAAQNQKKQRKTFCKRTQNNKTTKGNKNPKNPKNNP